MELLGHEEGNTTTDDGPVDDGIHDHEREEGRRGVRGEDRAAVRAGRMNIEMEDNGVDVAEDEYDEKDQRDNRILFHSAFGRSPSLQTLLLLPTRRVAGSVSSFERIVNAALRF